MKRFFAIIFLTILLLTLCSKAAQACRPRYYNFVTGTVMEWWGGFDDEAVFPWNTNSNSFQTITPPVPCSENLMLMQPQLFIPVILPSADSSRNALYAYNARTFATFVKALKELSHEKNYLC